MRRFGFSLVVVALLLSGLVVPVAATNHGEVSLAWAHNTGGGLGGSGFSVAVDAAGNVYVTGFFEGTDVDFDPGPDTYLLSGGNFGDIFVAKYDAAGGLVWAHRTGGGLTDGGAAVAVDALGNVYVTGFFEGASVDFDPGPDTHPLTSIGSRDIFVAKYDTAGNLAWAHRAGGSTGTFEQGSGIGVDTAGNVYVTGSFAGPDVDFDPGPDSRLLTSNGSSDVFVAKYDTIGSLVWAHNTGGITGDTGEGLAVDAAGNVYVTGSFQGEDTDFDPGAGLHPLSSEGFADIFVAKYDTAGNLIWAHSTGGGTGNDVGYGIGVDSGGGVYVTGAFVGLNVDFDPGFGSHLLSSIGSFDIFVAKYDSSGDLAWAHSVGESGFDSGRELVVDAAGSVYLTGPFSGIDVDFDPGPGSHHLTSGGGTDIFVAKYDTGGNLAWAHSTGSGNGDEGFGIAVDVAGSVYLTGDFDGLVDFDPGSGSHVLKSSGDEDFFVAKYAQSGVTRLAGANRFETAAAVAAHHYPGGAGSVFIGTGLNFPDALAGAAAAGLTASPLALAGSVPAATADLLDALSPSGIVLLGGTAVVSAADATALAAWAPVTRLAGPNRYDTAVAISQHAYPAAGSADVVVIATGANFPDALAAAAAANALGGPVLLTPTDSLPQTVVAEVGRLDPAQVIVIGGPAAISDSVFNQLNALKPTIRLFGANRYDTAVEISKHTFTIPALIDRVYIAVGTNFPDALAGAATAATAGAPVLLVSTTSVPASVVAEINRLGPTRIFILGGTAVISQAVESELAALLP